MHKSLSYSSSEKSKHISYALEHRLHFTNISLHLFASVAAAR
jgi:hypothetical protein